MVAPTGRDSDKFMLRLPDGLRDRIKRKADENGRSMNAEIVDALGEKFPVVDGLTELSLLIEKLLAAEDTDLGSPNGQEVAACAMILGEIMARDPTSDRQRKLAQQLDRLRPNVDEAKVSQVSARLRGMEK